MENKIIDEVMNIIGNQSDFTRGDFESAITIQIKKAIEYGKHLTNNR